jgi:hypothetical protein
MAIEDVVPGKADIPVIPVNATLINGSCADTAPLLAEENRTVPPFVVTGPLPASLTPVPPSTRPQLQHNSHRASAIHTVAQKTVPMFCHFGKTGLA